MKIKLSLRVINLCLWEKEIAESAKKLIRKRTKIHYRVVKIN